MVYTETAFRWRNSYYQHYVDMTLTPKPIAITSYEGWMGEYV